MSQKMDWEIPVLEELSVSRTMHGVSIHSHDGTQGGDDSSSGNDWGS